MSGRGLGGVFSHLDKITVSLYGILDGVALHEEGIVPLTVDHSRHSVVITLHEDIFLTALVLESNLVEAVH